MQNPSANSCAGQQRRYLMPGLAHLTIAGVSKAPNKQSKVTAEHREEAARLLKLWNDGKERLKARGVGTQEKFGAAFDIGNQAAVGFFLNGKTPLSAKAAAGFARGLGCQVADFSPRLAKILATAPSAAWPFPDIEFDRFDRLSLTAKIELQGVVRDRIESYERAAAQKAASAPPVATPDRKSVV